MTEKFGCFYKILRVMINGELLFLRNVTFHLITMAADLIC